VTDDPVAFGICVTAIVVAPQGSLQTSVIT